MGFDTIDPFPGPADLSQFFPEPAPAPALPMTDAERKRQERQARKDAGLPDLRTVDVAIVSALVAAMEEIDVPGQMRALGSARGLMLDLEPILRHALRGIRRGRVGGQPVTKTAAVEALQQRLRLR